jgi:hypothetical protein
MKHLLLFAVLLFLNSNPYSARTPQSTDPISFLNDKAAELVVSFEKLSPKQYEELDLSISGVKGINKIGFCERRNIYYFNFDITVFRNSEEAFNALIQTTKKFQPLMKIGSTIADVQRACAIL